MSVRAIRLYGDPVLRARAKPIARWTEALRALARDMVDTMRDANGVGLAAPQVGESLRIIVVDVEWRGGRRNPLALINPEIAQAEGEVTEEEGCLSIPDVIEEVTRAAKVIVAATNRSGEKFEMTGEGLLARALQHEIDHIDGVLLLDRLSRVKRDLIKGRLKKQGKASPGAVLL